MLFLHFFIFHLFSCPLIARNHFVPCKNCHNHTYVLSWSIHLLYMAISIQFETSWSSEQVSCSSKNTQAYHSLNGLSIKKHHNMITTYYIKLKSWKLNYSLTKSFSSQISLIILRSIMYLLQNCRFSHLYSSLNKKGKRKRFPLNNHWQVAIMYHYSKSTNILHPLCGCPMLSTIILCPYNPFVNQ